MSRWDPRRAARALVLTAWTSFVLWLLLSGEVYRYIGTRTYWVVVFGAITLVVTTLAQLMTLRTKGVPRPLTVREGAGLAALLCPILAVVMIPTPSLGARAAAARATGGALSTNALVPTAPGDDEEVTFVDVYYASASDEYAAAAGISDGYAIELTGFVTHGPETPSDGFTLTRFSVSCCAADAIPYSVPVVDVTGTSYEDDTWLRVAGTLHEADGHYVLNADTVERVREPEDPYIY